MWIKIENSRIDLSKVCDYRIYKNRITLYYPVFTGEYNDEQHEHVFAFETEIEAKTIIKQIDELLGVKKL